MRRHILQHRFFFFLFLYNYMRISTLETIQSVPVLNRLEINPLLFGFYKFSLISPFVIILLVVVSEFVVYLLKGAVERKRDWLSEPKSFLIRQETVKV